MTVLSGFVPDVHSLVSNASPEFVADRLCDALIEEIAASLTQPAEEVAARRSSAECDRILPALGQLSSRAVRTAGEASSPADGLARFDQPLTCRESEKRWVQT